jgi:hypothetical protein
MGLFGRKNTESTLRFCQSATELDTSHLFSDWPLTLAISRLTELLDPTLGATEEADGYGLVHETFGGGGPLLPVQVQFLFSPPDTEGEPGHGSVWKNGTSQEDHYKAEVIIYDPDRRIYEGFQRVFEHAAISGNSFAHLILVRKKKPFISDPKERKAARKAEEAECERLKALMKQVDAGEADMPDIVFDRVAFEDNLVLKAPSWSWGWIDDPLSWSKYHSREIAYWRRSMRRR